NQPFFSENINALAAPNFDGFPFRQYLAPQSVLPIQFSRGCYYKDCAFCALTLDHQNFRQRAPEKVVDDVKGLMERYQTPFFFFTDECFALAPTKRLCRQLIEAGVNAQWTCEMRVEKNLTRDLLKLMRDAGGLKIVFGLESYNQRVMDFMKKGIGSTRTCTKRSARWCASCHSISPWRTGCCTSPALRRTRSRRDSSGVSDPVEEP